MNRFKIIPGDRFIWNRDQLESFLINHQHQPITLDVNSEGCDLAAIGLYNLLDKFQFTRVTIWVVNRLEHHPVYDIRYLDHIRNFFNIIDFDYTPVHYWTGNKIFGALFNRPIWHRIGIIGHLYHNYRASSLINLRASCDTEDSRAAFEIGELFRYDPMGARYFTEMSHKLPLQLEETDTWKCGVHTKQFSDQLASFYTDFLIDIVGETFVSGKTFFPTEKTVRPMLMKKPFIIMGPENFLIYLRQMGFRTFHDFWPEEYDGYENKPRYHMILDLIEMLSKKSKQELRTMYADMSEILNHNYDLLVSQGYTTNIEYVPNI